MMDMMYRPLLPPTQYCPCIVNPIGLSSLPNYNNPSPFFRALFAPYTPLWINPSPQRVDNSPSVAIDAPPQQDGIDFRLAFERKKKIEAKHLDSMVPFRSLYIPKGRWHWTHQVTFEDRSEHIRMRDSQQYTQTIKIATIYQETITYISKLWYRETRWEGFAREVALHKTQLRAIHGVTVPALIGIHSNVHGIQMSYDIPHHSFWIEASPDMPDVLKRRCIQAYDQLHCQGVLHGSVEFENILITGDGRVKIINFDRSQSTKPLPRVHLKAANQDDFKLEMREIHYKLDYMGAREIEHSIWKNKDNPRPVQPPASNTKGIYAHYPYFISRETPIDPAQWTLPESWKPKRFIAPGQSVEQYKHHLKQLLLEIADEAGEGMDPPIFSRPTSQKLNKRKREDNDLDDSESAAHKRSRIPSDTDEIGRKVRFEQETDYSDGTTCIKRKLARSPPPGRKRSVPRIPRERREAYARGRHHGLGGYAPNIPPDTECPYIPPLLSGLNRRHWERPQSSADVWQADEGNTPETPRSLGKRGRTDSGETSRPRGLPQAKRLRRTESMLSVLDDPADLSLSQESPSSRYPSRPLPQAKRLRRTESMLSVLDDPVNLSPSQESPPSRYPSRPLSRRTQPATTRTRRIDSPPRSPSHVSDEIPWGIFDQTSASQMILGPYSDALPSSMPPGIQFITYEELEEMERAANQRRSPAQTIRLIATEFCYMTARAFAQAFGLEL